MNLGEGDTTMSKRSVRKRRHVRRVKISMRYVDVKDVRVTIAGVECTPTEIHGIERYAKYKRQNGVPKQALTEAERAMRIGLSGGLSTESLLGKVGTTYTIEELREAFNASGELGAVLSARPVAEVKRLVDSLSHCPQCRNNMGTNLACGVCGWSRG